MNIRTNLSLAIILALLVAACGGKKTTEETTETETETVATEATYKVDTASSTVAWSGEVAGVYGHNGVIEITEGMISTKGDTITGGKVVIDMTTIQPLDSASYSEEHPASDLVNHLSTGDFFLVETYPTSSFVIKSQLGSELTGDLTVRGITKEEKATITSLVVTPEGLTATADLVFNRQDYEVSWVHYMQDMILSDDIKIKLNIVAKP
ncbi:YceI family protein [Reichenbachiella agarivorans]|uniref:YceI family protein n=1 Tax=Reichenbachiella agarivorans TaxID=2979464 RepID=A0ABY6CM45_9BACT|nr:YceI family protein [Reichenbachiella agarivorans]UXP31542.1 YceI family protein [Reichenbachiella agarivorans]